MATRRRYDDDDDYDDRDNYDSRRRRRQSPRTSVLGIFSLIKGVTGLVISLIPCIGAVGIVVCGIGLILGIIGLIVAKKSRGEVGTGLPLAGTIVSVIGMLIAGVWIAIMGVALSGSGGGASAPVSGDSGTADAPAFTLTAVELDREYDTNEPAADGKYKGKWVEVTGKVKKVTGDTHPGKMTVELVGIEDSTVDCMFPNSQKAELAALKAGQEVTVRGRCKGKVRTWVTLEDCTRVTKEAAREKEKPADAGPATKVTATELAKAYGENVVAADGKYKGKTLEVSGEVLRVVRSKPGKVTVELDAEEGDGLIRCDFPAKESQSLAAVKAGQKVVIRGRCAGEVDEFVTLDGCSLVK